MNYEKKYKEANDKIAARFGTNVAKEIFTDLYETDDERIKKCIIDTLKGYHHLISTGGITKEDMIAWIEKQGEQEQLYIRFGDIPTDEKSKIYKGETEVGTENGVSVYPAFKTSEGNIVLGLSLPITKTTLHTQQHLLEYDDRPCYLVKGDYVGKDTDGQPLINNVSIVEKIDTYRVKEEKQCEQKETLCDKCKKEQPSHSCQDITALGRCALENQAEQQSNHCDECINRKGCINCENGELKETEQNSDTVEPTFKIGDTIIKKHNSDINKFGQFIITDIRGGKYWHNSKIICDISEQYEWELVKQKPVDEVEPKFKVDDWIVYNRNDHSREILQVYDIRDDRYYFTDNVHFSWSIKECDEKSHLWSIEDTKNGDILATEYGRPFIFKDCSDTDHPSGPVAYCGIDCADEFKISTGNKWWTDSKVCPATKEQCELLLKKMEEAGYEWIGYVNNI